LIGIFEEEKLVESCHNALKKCCKRAGTDEQIVAADRQGMIN